MAFRNELATAACSLDARAHARTFRILHNYTFLVSIPKWREIFATEFAGRIIDHILCDILKPWIERLHPRTFNNREGMGSQGSHQPGDRRHLRGEQRLHRNGMDYQVGLGKVSFPNANCDYMESCFVRVIDRFHDDSRQCMVFMPRFLNGWRSTILLSRKAL